MTDRYDTDAGRKPWSVKRRRIVRVIGSPYFAASTAGLTIISLLIAISAMTATSANTRAQIRQTDRTAVFLADTFCGAFEQIAYPPVGTPPPSTKFGLNLQASSKNAVARLKCTTDRNDNK